MELTNMNDDIFETVTPISLRTNSAIILLQDVKFGLSVIGFLTNFITILTIAITVGAKMKPSTKLVTSLAFSDMLIALFNIVNKFIHYTSQWTFWLDNEVWLPHDKSLPQFFADGMLAEHDQERLPHDATLDDNLKEKLTKHIKDTETMNDASNEFNHSGGPLSFDLFLEDTIVGVSSFTVIDNNVLTNILSCLSIVPDITCVLNIVLISMTLLIMVSKPLKYHIILSKGRTTVLVVMLWTLAFLVSLVAYFSTLNESEQAVGNTLLSIYLIIWYVVFVFCIILPMLYGVVLIIVFKQGSEFRTRNKKHLKACVTSFVIVITYIFGYLPFVWDRLFRGAFGSNTDTSVRDVFQCIYAVKTILDAFIHSIRMEEVKNGYKILLRKMKNLCLLW